jgi:hypothetical protein
LEGPARPVHVLRRPATAVAAMMLLVMCTSGERPPVSGSGSPGPGSEPEVAFAVWPEDTRSSANLTAFHLQAGDDPWRGDPARTARRFALLVMGWPDAAVGPVVPEDGSDLREVTLARVDGRATVRLILGRVVQDRWWSVLAVMAGRPRPLRVTVHGRDAVIRFDREQAFDVGITLGYGALTSTRYRRSGQVRFRLPSPPRTSGHVLLVYRDANRQVFDAQGVGLPAGDVPPA